MSDNSHLCSSLAIKILNKKAPITALLGHLCLATNSNTMVKLQNHIILSLGNELLRGS